MIIKNKKVVKKNFISFLEANKNRLLSDRLFTSFTFQIEEIIIDSFLDYLQTSQDGLLRITKPDSNVNILAIGELLSLINDNSINPVDELELFKQSCINNFDKIGFSPPIVFGYAKFPSEKTSTEWSDFNPVSWFIPKIVISESDKKNYITLNFSKTSSSELISELNNYISLIEKFYSTEKETQSANIKIKISSTEQREDWTNSISNIVEKIDEKNLLKVVASRRKIYSVESTIDLTNIVNQLNKNFPECYNFVLSKNDSTFFGASPEKLLSFNKNNIFTEALAGSINRGNNEEEDQHYEDWLMKSIKNKSEHNIVVNHLLSILNNHCEDINSTEYFGIKKLSNIQHLQSKISATLQNGTSIFSVLSDMFPTPAVCGYPVQESKNIINEFENYDRGLYSGFIGWMNLDDVGEIFVTIRSALNKGNELFVYAGCGIVKDSNPDDEFEETELKSNAILSLFDVE